MNEMIYTQLLDSRIICLFGEINHDLSDRVISELLLLDRNNHKDISLYIDSCGGDLSAALSIIDTMKIVKSDICTYNVSRAHSSASLIMVCGKKGKRYSLPSATMVVHEPLTTTGNYYVGASNFETLSSKLIEKRKQLLKLYEKATGLSEEVLLKMMKEDTELNAAEMRDKGFCDSVL